MRATRGSTARRRTSTSSCARRTSRGALDIFEAAGYQTELPFPHWLAKVEQGDHVMDLIFSSGNGVARVDDEWFAHAAESEVLGRRLQLCPIEEIIWSKAFVQERERFDGADVLHLLREAGPDIDWTRLLARFGDYWPVLLGHLIAFHFAYPDRRDRIPPGLIGDLAARLVAQPNEPGNRVCYGTLLSREQFLPDVEQLGYEDARLEPRGNMSREELRLWSKQLADERCWIDGGQRACGQGNQRDQEFNLLGS